MVPQIRAVPAFKGLSSITDYLEVPPEHVQPCAKLLHVKWQTRAITTATVATCHRDWSVCCALLTERLLVRTCRQNEPTSLHSHGSTRW
jgi:hypothetical protein